MQKDYAKKLDFHKIAGMMPVKRVHMQKDVAEKKRKVASKMKPYKISHQKKGESDHEHWGRLAKEFYAHGKDKPNGKPLHKPKSVPFSYQHPDGTVTQHYT